MINRGRRRDRSRPEVAAGPRRPVRRLVGAGGLPDQVPAGGRRGVSAGVAGRPSRGHWVLRWVNRQRARNRSGTT